MATPAGFGFEGEHYTLTYYDGYPLNFIPDIQFAYKVFGWWKLKSIIIRNKGGYKKISPAGTYIMGILTERAHNSKQYVSKFLDSLDCFKKGDIGEPDDYIEDPVETAEGAFNIGAKYVYKLNQEGIVYNNEIWGVVNKLEKWENGLFNKRNIVERLFELSV